MPRKTAKNKTAETEHRAQAMSQLEQLAALGRVGVLDVYGHADTATIKFGVLRALKMTKHEKKTAADMVMMLTAEQVAYLNLRAEGLFSEDICKVLGLDRMSPVLWNEENDVFAHCMDGIKAVEANDAEEMLWLLAKKSPMASSERTFGLTGRKPEYNKNRELEQGGAKIVVYVQGTQFDVSKSLKSGDDESE